MIDLNNLDGFDNMEELQKELNKRMIAHNSKPIDDFDGLSPEEMATLQHRFPNSKTPLGIRKLSEKELEQCPILMQVRYLIDKMKGGKHIELTKTGALRPALAKEIYALGYIKDEWIEEGISKFVKEGDVYNLSLTRILLQISSLAKKRNDKLSLTKKGEKLAEDGNAILNELIYTLIYKFNWAYGDGYDSEDIGKVNPGYSFYLLKKYGDKEQNAEFYAALYFKALPMLLMGDEKTSYYCYISRTFRTFFKYFGFIEIKEKIKWSDPFILKKTPFFDALFSKG